VRQNPEGFIEYGERWPGLPSLQRCELLAKSQVSQEADRAERGTLPKPLRAKAETGSPCTVANAPYLWKIRPYPVEIPAE
jgi:hypothetical protein